MPELPEVETVRRGLAPLLEGRRLDGLAVRRRDLRRPVPPDLAERLIGRRLVRLDRRAKYLLWRFEEGTVMIHHLGMSGRMLVLADPEAPAAHDHVDWTFADAPLVRFRDPRRFGLVVLGTAAGLADHPCLADLGPEPLDDGFDGPALAARLGGSRAPIKTRLLDQSVVAGLGNIYVCEALYRAGISPWRPAADLDGPAAARLADAIRGVLTAAIAAGGSSLRDHARVDGTLGYFQKDWAVYGRAGAPCPDCDCDPDRTGGIQCQPLAGRSTFHCPRRQG